jgi:monofunctional biosynthetic peptidoglycan transglycosylase
MTARRQASGFFRRARKFLGRVFLAGFLAFALFACWLAATFPDVSSLAAKNPESTPFMEWKARRLEGTAFRMERKFVPYGEISWSLKEAVRKSEDPLFFSHRGFDWAEMRSAVRDWWTKGKKLRGASTITMQTARLMFLTPARSPVRKIREALITVSMERKLSKERIFELYLNYSDWGNGAIGAEAVARRHFGASCRSLGCREAAALAAMLPAPDLRSPARPSRAMQRHMNRLMRRMGCGGAAPPSAKEEKENARAKEEEEEEVPEEETAPVREGGTDLPSGETEPAPQTDSPESKPEEEESVPPPEGSSV